MRDGGADSAENYFAVAADWPSRMSRRMLPWVPGQVGEVPADADKPVLRGHVVDVIVDEQGE